jgi:hypothetical protein
VLKARSQDALELLLSGVKDQAERKQITTAYYAFANGYPETFAVQFAVLLRAHAISLKLLPARLEKTLSAETRRLGDLVVAHQNSVQRMVSLLQDVEACDRGERKDACETIGTTGEEQLAAYAEVLASEREKINAALTMHGKLLQRLAADRALLSVGLSYAMGLLTVLALPELICFVLRHL